MQKTNIEPQLIPLKDLFERMKTKWQQERMYSEEEVKEIEIKQQGYSDEELLKILQKFGFDYTYNYKGEKTIYKWIPEWFQEYKRLEQFKNK